MIKQTINQSIWLSLPKETRDKICVIFNIPRSGFVEVSNNRVICDGHSDSDLALITIEKLQEVLDAEIQDFYKLFGDLVEKLQTKPEDTKVPEVKNDVIEEKVVVNPVLPNSKGVIKTESPKPVKARGRSKKT